MIREVVEFLADMRLCKRRPATILNYHKVLKLFEKYVSVDSAAQVTVQDTRGFLESYMPTVRNNTYFMVVARLKKFFKKYNRAIYDYLCTLDIKLEESDTEPFTMKEIYAIAEELDRRAARGPFGDLGKTYSTIHWILVSTGMRIGEFCKLNMGDKEEKDGFYIFHLRKEITKTHKARDVRIRTTSITGIAFRRYLDGRGKLGGDAPLFVNSRGSRIRPHNVEVQYERVKKRLGLTKKCSPHVCRHTIRELLKKRKVDPKTIADLLGHDVKTLMKTYTFVSDEDRQEVARSLPF